MGKELYRYKPETITRTLRNLRSQIIRNGEPEQEHVEAPLQMRGDNLGSVPRKANLVFRRGKLRVTIFTALRQGQLVGQDVVMRVCAAHDLDYDEMYCSVYAQLRKLMKAGQVRHEGRLWLLALGRGDNPIRSLAQYVFQLQGTGFATRSLTCNRL